MRGVRAHAGQARVDRCTAVIVAYGRRGCQRHKTRAAHATSARLSPARLVHQTDSKKVT